MVEIFFHLGSVGFPFVHETVDVLLELFLPARPAGGVDRPFLSHDIGLEVLVRVFLWVQLRGIGRDEQHLDPGSLFPSQPFVELLGLVGRVVARLPDGQVIFVMY